MIRSAIPKKIRFIQNNSLWLCTVCLLLTKLSMLIIPIPPSLILKQHLFLSIWFGFLSQMNFQIKSFTSFLFYISLTEPGTPSFQFQIPFEPTENFNNQSFRLKVKFQVFQTWVQLFISYICGRQLIYIYVYRA